MTVTSPRVASFTRDDLTAAVAKANIPALVPVLYQLTGDPKWLEEPYRPTRTRGMDEHADGGLPPEVRGEIRAGAVEAVLAWSAGRPPAVPAPTGDLLIELATLCMGEQVPAEYEPMTAENLGFRPAPQRHALAGLSVVVIGAGVSGITASRYLKDAGIDHVVLEKNPDVGGTWRNNRYPGCGVDTPSYLYSFTWFRRAWERHFGKRAQVEQYLKDLASHHDLLPSIRFGVEVLSAAWDDTTRRWTVRTRESDGSEHEIVANCVITAVGQLNVPKIPDLPGVEEFHGPVFHSAQWPEGLDLHGRSLAVIGTGASGMQIVPAVVDEVASLTIYQRSPQWVAPNANYFQAVPPETHWLMDHVPFYYEWYRFRLAWAFNDKIHASLQKDPTWPHPERSLNAVNDAHRAFFTRYLVDQLEGREDLVAKALPTYPPFGKRMLLDNGWFKALRRPHVELVTRNVASLTRDGVRDTDGVVRPADAVVLATGFEAHRPIHVDITGRSGQSLQDTWGDDEAEAYLGITTPGFPNLFFMYGPNTNLGHGGSFVFLAERQINYIVDALVTMTENGIESLECRPEVNERYNRALDEAHSRMVWTHQGMDTWYRNSKGRVVTNMPWRVLDYWTMTRSVNLADFIVEPTPDGA
jgi:4-hydroxyacetophenone monooxygenase